MLIVYVIIGVVVLGVIGGAVYFLFMRRGEETVVQERLGRYAEAAVQAAPEAQKSKDAGPKGKSALAEKLNDSLRGQSFFASTQKMLSAADLKLNVGEFVALCIICSIGGVLLAVGITVAPECLSAPNPVSCLMNRGLMDMVMALGGGVVGFIAPRFYAGFRRDGRVQTFKEQLGDTLNLMVNALRSGYSVMQAMEAVSRELPPPISVEFKRVVQEVQLGLPMETALAHLLERMTSDDLDLVITAMNVQREVGGNLAEILDVISYTIRERVRIKGEIATLTSQGMATGFAITAMPFALGALLFVINRPYIGQFFEARNQPCGWGMIIAGLILVGIGGFTIKKIIDIEV